MTTLPTFELREPTFIKNARRAKAAAELFARDTGKTTVELRQIAHRFTGPWERWTVVNGVATREAFTS